MSYFGVIFPLRSKTTKRLHENHSNSPIFNDALRISWYRLLVFYVISQLPTEGVAQKTIYWQSQTSARHGLNTTVVTA